MAKDSIVVEIKKIPIEVRLDGMSSEDKMMMRIKAPHAITANIYSSDRSSRSNPATSAPMRPTPITFTICIPSSERAIRSFAFAMILGVVFGTLSSIFIASPVAYLVMGRKIKETDVEVAKK